MLNLKMKRGTYSLFIVCALLLAAVASILTLREVGAETFNKFGITPQTRTGKLIGKVAPRVFQAKDRKDAAAEPASTTAIPFDQLGAAAQKQYSGDGIGITPTANGAHLRAMFQKLEANATPTGLWLVSKTEEDSARGSRFRVLASALGRRDAAGAVIDRSPLPSTGEVRATSEAVSFARRGVTEEYRVGMDGVRQEFVIAERPAGEGELALELSLSGARAEAASNGVRLRLRSGRTLAYHRLRATDAEGRELSARLEVTAANRLLLRLNDAGAAYPLRLAPTFSDADWVSLNPGLLGTNNDVNAVAVDGGGNLYIGGDFNLVGTVQANRIAKWNGSAWSALGSGMNLEVQALAVSGTDLYAGGFFTTAGGVTASHIAKWNGSAWSALGSGMNGTVNALAVSGTDLYAGGFFTTAGGVTANFIAKWNGSAWSALGSGMNGIVNALAVSGTDLYAGGFFTTADGVPVNNIAKWNGSAWSALGLGVNGQVNALAVSGTDIYAGGAFLSAGGVPAKIIAKWNGSAWSALGSGMSGVVYALAVSGTDLYAGGNFTTAGGVPANHIAKWNGSAWSALGSGMGFTVYALAVSGTELYAGGNFTTAGGVPASRIAKWNGSAWSALGSGMDGTVNALAVSGTELYAGGSFITADGVTVNRIAKWNGSAWSALGSGVIGAVNVLVVSGTNLYVGGEFITADGVTVNRIAKWNGSAWSALGSGMSDFVFALAVDNSSHLFLGGSFSLAGTTFSPFIVQANLNFPQINVQGNGQTIANGDTTPDAADHTDFGSVAAAAGTITRTFTIQNPGNAALNLTGSPKVAVSGTNAADFSVTVEPVSPVAASGSTTFQITFDPGGIGLRSASISIASDDGARNPYTFSIQGTGLNTAPGITAQAGVSRQQGSPVSNSTIATVNDVDTGANSVVVTVSSANPSNGVTLSNIVNTNGTITADIVADCAASNAGFTLQAGDGSLTATATLNVGVTAATPPTAANAGLDQTFCGTSAATLAANTPSSGTGAWSIVSGPSLSTAQFSSLTNPAATFTPAGGIGAYTLRWTVTGTCAASTDDVVLTYNVVPTITLGANPSVFTGATSANLTYSATTGSPNQYSIDYNPAANTAGFADVTNSALTASPIVLVVPGAAAPGTYNAMLTVRNSATGCVGSATPLTITISACVTSLTVNDTGDGADAAPGNGVCETAAGNGVCTLRAAIQEANAQSVCSPFTINFSVTGTINLATGLPTLVHPNLTLNGPGAGLLTVRRNAVTPFNVLLYNRNGGSLTVNGMTIRDGLSELGGGLYVTGSLTLNDCVVTNNAAIFGGGIVAGQQAAFGPAGLTINNSTISGNSTDVPSSPFPYRRGGGIYAGNVTATITNSTISGNFRTGTGDFFGSALYFEFVSGTLTNCTISGNTGTQVLSYLAVSGGGNGTLTLTNCTVAGNTLNNPTTAHGVLDVSGTVAVTATLQLKNTLVAGNTVGLGANFRVGTGGVLTSLGNNLDSDGSSGLTSGVNGNLVGTVANPLNALLTALGNYTGSTQTHALLPGSPAINAGTASGAPANDQRGLARVGNVDIGALEAQAFTLTASGGNNQSTVANTAFANSLTVSVGSAFNEPVEGAIITFTPPASGAGASLAGSPATVNAGGQASVTATANNVPGSYQVSATAQNGRGATNFTLTNLNSAPTFTPAAALSRQQGSPAGAAVTIGTVADAQTSAGSLTVTQIAGGTATGINVTGITNNNGTITAVVSADCAATGGTVRFQVSDGDLTSTGDLQVNLTASEVNVTGNGNPIADGSTTPSPTNHTDFGSAALGGGTVTRTFTIANAGTAALNLTSSPNKVALSGANAGDFSVTVQPASPVAASGGATTFTIEFNPSAPGTRSATVTIVNDDCDENPYDFSIRGASNCVTSLTVNDPGDGADAAIGDAVCATSGGVCTLRAAIQEANLVPLFSCSPLTINFSVTGTINPGTALPSLNHPNLIINGPGANLLTVSAGGGSYGVFQSRGGIKTLNGLTITGGNASEGGGGIDNINGSTLTVMNCTVTGNTSTGQGGGIFNWSGNTLSVINSTISNNTSNLSTSIGGGGGIGNAGTLTVTNSTITGNTRNNGNNNGGGIWTIGNTTITNSTITNNTVAGTGRAGGLYQAFGFEVVTVRNSIIAGNNSNTTVPDVGGGFATTGGGYNLIGNVGTATGFNQTGDQTGTDAAPLNPLLGSLGNYGGPTSTHALLPGSPAINAGTAGGAPANDQRGIARVGAVDIGAFESQGFTVALAGGNNQSAPVNTAFATPLSVTVSSNFSEPVNDGRVTFTPPATGAGAGIAGNPAVISGGTATTGTVTANAIVGAYNVAASAGGAPLPVNFSLTNLNTAPSFTPATIARRQGSPAGAAITIGTVSDAQTPAGNLTVTQIAGGTATGITVTDIVNSGGTVSAFISAACNAGGGTVRFQVSDGDLTSTGDLTVNVTANSAPTLSYPISGVALNSATTVTPTTATDNGSIASYSIVSVTPPLTTAPTVNAAGVVSVTNAAPFGLHTITVRATDNCGATTEVQFTLNVGCGSLTVTPATLINGLTFVPYSSTLSASGGSGSYVFTLTSGTLPAGLTLNGNTISGTPNTAGASTFTIRATDDNGCIGQQTYTLLIGSTGLKYYPLARPVRLLDTRPGASPNACFQPNAPIPGNTARLQPARGVCEGLTIPANATTITGNITTVESGGGFITIYPSDAPRPLVANSNYSANEVLNNAFTVGVGAQDGAVRIFVTSDTDVVVDVTGYYAPPEAGGLYFHPLPRPVRLLETRAGFTGCFAPGTPLPGGVNTPQLGTGSCQGLTIPSDALALVGNATTVNPQGGGYLTLYPANATQPLVASSNYAAGQVVNGPFTVGLSPSGQFNIFTPATTDLVVDITGYYSAQANDANGQGLLFTSLGSPLRLLETRAGEQGCYTPGAPMTSGTVYTQETQSPCTNLTPTARALIGNATVVNTTAEGYLTFWPADATQPLVATSNYVAGQVFNRYFTVGLSSNGSFKRFALRTTDLVIDISGFFAP